MALYFDKFPRIVYDINNGQLTNFERPTNIFFRIGILQSVLSNISAYYDYLIKDSDTPDILAYNIYGSSEAHWIILLANGMIDPQYDWPLNSRAFKNYIINKYGSVENAKLTTHHYNLVITREESLTGTVTETNFQINYNTQTDGQLTITSANGNYTVGETVYISSNTVANATYTANVVSWTSANGKLVVDDIVRTPGETVRYKILKGNTSSVSGTVSSIDYPNYPYEYFVALPANQSVETINMGNGRTVIQTTSRSAISNYDYEEELNESKRAIKIIKPEYYSQIVNEFNNITNSATSPFVRRLV